MFDLSGDERRPLSKTAQSPSPRSKPLLFTATASCVVSVISTTLHLDTSHITCTVSSVTNISSDQRALTHYPPPEKQRPSCPDAEESSNTAPPSSKEPSAPGLTSAVLPPPISKPNHPPSWTP
eukprot:scaffold4208_cov199-Alexandrium_tamarense.AAC.6